MTDKRPGTRRSFYFIHRWTALLLGPMALVVFYTGAVAVFAEEIGVWAQRDRPVGDVAALAESGRLDEHLAALHAVDPDHIQSLSIHGADRGFVTLLATRRAEDGEELEGPSTLIRRLDVESGEVVSESAGEAPGIFQVTLPRESLERFFLNLHIRLLLEGRLGLWVTGLAGFALMLLVATGVYVHWPSKHRALRGIRRTHARRWLGDLHTWVGMWSLPFTAVLGFTGAFFSLAGSILIPLFAVAAYGGDIEAIEEAIKPPVEVQEADHFAALGPIAADAEERSGGELFRLAFAEAPEGGGMMLTVNTGHHGWTFSQHTYLYDAHEGTYLQEAAGLGRGPSVASWLVQLVGALHFGTLAGFWSKLLWFLLGLLTSALAGTGFALWAVREQRTGSGWAKRLIGLIASSCTALPLATAVTVLVWAAAVSVGWRTEPLMALGFGGTLAAAAGLGAWLRPDVAMRLVFTATAVAFAVAPAAGVWVSGAASLIDPMATGVDVTFILVAVLSAGLAGLWGRLLRPVGPQTMVRPAAPEGATA